MESPVFALLIHGRPHPLEALKDGLKALSVETHSVRTCEGLEHLISHAQPPLIFSDTSLPDGTWANVVSLAEEAAVPVNVSVVGACEDIRLCLSVLERGAFDFVLPPFERRGLDFVVKSAAADTFARRQARVLVAASWGVFDSGNPKRVPPEPSRAALWLALRGGMHHPWMAAGKRSLGAQRSTPAAQRRVIHC